MFRLSTYQNIARYQKTAAWLWLASCQYFVVQLLAARAWAEPFSLRTNTISDLGNTVCGPYGGRLVCSPLHSLMNLSFIVLGGTMAGGALVLLVTRAANGYQRLGFSGLILAGLGTILVGFFPENSVAAFHIIGAAAPFLLGNLSLVLLGVSLPLSPGLRAYTIITGLVALLALGLLVSGHYLGLGVGGMERLTAYPQTLWLIVFGANALLTARHPGRRR